MKVVVILLAVGLLILGVLYYQEGQHGKVAIGQLTAVSNQFAAAQVELASVKTQMSARVAELESTLATNKVLADEQIGQLQGRVKAVEQDLQDEKNKLATVEDERTKVVNQLNAVSNQLTSVRQRYAYLARTSTATEMELKELREREATLEMEKASLDRQLNDLDSLKAQIHIVKRQLWEKHVTEWKRQDEEAGRAGNKGMLFQNGQWQAGLKPGS